MRIVAMLSATLCAGTLSTVAIDVAPRVIWNASASVPVGLYAVLPTSSPQLGDLVLVEPPEDLARYLDRRGYLPRGLPMLKRVAALPGQTICRNGAIVRLDGKAVAAARAEDSRGRSLPSWSGCHRLRQGQVFLLNVDTPDSLDGRYFGPLPVSALRGRAVPIRTRATP
ncbi:S26 family signal peptidase [Roseicyclus sp. F158]|uniref:S26 family signal peptidase n=1 Tax=Tropicimonas omnivorans TaxID=3075590 RepID=A0ABU3DLQ1_9RHOB|nr:S26 family signal peptidase [Roseicyclus sp. F158]MDT0684042.1 S26 family signal peptidase [Roseicyclus sp. F158]